MKIWAIWVDQTMQNLARQKQLEKLEKKALLDIATEL